MTRSLAPNEAFEQLDEDAGRRLVIFEALVRKWTPKINLVAASTLNDFRTRHIADSLQLFALRPSDRGAWVDLGSGGGFPGMVIAIAAAAATPDLRVTLVESDQRKVAFLRTVSRETGVICTIVDQRIENIPPLQADILSARALAPLTQLCSYARRHMVPNGTALFSKGASFVSEVQAARATWRFDVEEITSETDPQARILRLKGLSHV